MEIGGGRNLTSIRVLAPGLFVALLAAMAIVATLAADPGRTGRVAQGVRALGRDFSNLKREEVAAAVREASEEYVRRPLKIRYGSAQFALTPAEAGVSVDVNATAERIIAVGRQDTLADRLSAFAGGRRQRTVLPVLLVDGPRLDAVLGKMAGSIDRPARDAALSIGPVGFTLQPAQSALHLDVAETGRRLVAQLADWGNGEVEAAVSEVVPKVGDRDWREAADMVQRILSAPLVLRHEQRSWTLAADDLARFLVPDPPKVPANPATVRWDDAALAARVAALAQQVDAPARDSGVEWREGKFLASEAVPGRTVDVPATVAAIKRASESASRELALVVQMTAPAASTSDWDAAVEAANRAVASPLKLSFGEQSWSITPDELGPMLTFTSTQAGPARFAVALDEERIAVFLERVAKQIDRPVRDARFKLQGGKVALLAESQEGLTMDIPATGIAVARQVFGDQRTVAIPVRVSRPKFLASDAANVSFPQVLMDAATSYAGSMPERAHNVELAASRLNGTIVAPGAVFSFNESVGPTTLDAGYRIGYGITLRGNQPVTVPSEAGGICQVATTVFHAAFWAGMPIVQRQGHLYWIPRYGTPPRGMRGLDATVEDPYLDFKFRNATQDWMLVEASADGAILRFVLHGTDPGWEVKVGQPVIGGSVKAPNAIVRQEDDTLPKGKELWIERAEDGFTASIQRTVLKDGQIVDSLDVASYYRPSQNVILVGTREPTPAPAATPQPEATAEAPPP